MSQHQEKNNRNIQKNVDPLSVFWCCLQVWDKNNCPNQGFRSCAREAHQRWVSSNELYKQ